MNINQKTVNTIRVLSAEAVEKAKSGHPGLPLGAAPMAYELWANHLNNTAKDPKWINRDRFVLSAGHGSAMLYSILHIFGYDVSKEDLMNFRQLNSPTAGHPEYGHVSGVDATTGPLGQGIAMSVGMAMAEEHLADKFNREGFPVFDHYTYVLCGDGDLQEGVSQEASSLAGTLKLGKLIMLYDSNNITIEGSTDLSFTEDVLKRYEAYGWDIQEVEDGNNLQMISEAIELAKKLIDKPSLIKINTEIGFGSPKVGTAGVHGSPLGEEALEATKKSLNWEEKEWFTVPDDVAEHMENIVYNKEILYNNWISMMEDYKKEYPELHLEFINWQGDIDVTAHFEDASMLSFGKDMASRAASGEVLNRLSNIVPNLFGGSADLAPSNNSNIKNSGSFSSEDRGGRNIHFGIREFAMAAIANGISLHGGLRPYVATFFVFSDYLKPAMRLSAIMNQPVIYILTHDSIGVGEDGPTHQPVEQLAMLRSIPNLITIRPADNRETAVAWHYAISSKENPVALVLSRQTLPSVEGTGKDLLKGAYIVNMEEKQLDLIIIATGSEVSLAVDAAHMLEGEGYGVRVVSMPSMELFNRQSEEYKNSILPLSCRKRIAVEAGSSFGWGKYVGIDGDVIGIDRFGMSGPGAEVFEALNITSHNIVSKAKNILE